MAGVQLLEGFGRQLSPLIGALDEAGAREELEKDAEGGEGESRHGFSFEWRDISYHSKMFIGGNKGEVELRSVSPRNGCKQTSSHLSKSLETSYRPRR